MTSSWNDDGCNKLTYRISWACGGGCGSWSCSPHGLELECRKARMRARSIWLWMSMFFPIGSARLLHAPLGKREEAGSGLLYRDQSAGSQIEPLFYPWARQSSGTVQYFITERVNYRKTIELKPCVFMSPPFNLIAILDLLLKYIIWQQTSEEETFWRWPFQSQMSELQSPPGYLLLAKQFQSKCN